MSRLPGAAAATVFLVLVSCTTARPPESIRLPAARIVLRGYSFQPLQEQGWFIGRRTADGILVARYGTHLDESFIVQATRLPAKGVSTQESLLGYVGKKERAIDPKDRRYRNAREDVSTVSVAGALCAVQEGEAEDHGALTRSGRRDPMVLRVREMVCIHPTQKDTLVVLGYSHRHYAEDRDAAFRERSQALFDSVDFDAR